MRMFLTVVEGEQQIRSLVVGDHYEAIPHFGVEIDVTREEIVGLNESSFCERYLVPGVCQIKNRLVEG